MADFGKKLGSFGDFTRFSVQKEKKETGLRDLFLHGRLLLQECVCFLNIHSKAITMEKNTKKPTTPTNARILKIC